VGTSGPVATARRALGQILEAAARRDTAAAIGTVHVLDAPVTTASNPFDFRWSSQLVRDGYTLAAAWLRGSAQARARAHEAA
jgi:hypothetical protein